jgi:hypothetical protein
MKNIHTFLGMITVACICAHAANTGPEVFAGNDTTIRVGYAFYLRGTVEDDGMPNAEPVTDWRQIDGPESGMQVLAAFSVRTKVAATGTGIYTFELTADDGEFITADTIIVTVIDEIPFVVLSPEAGENIRFGDTVIISWQIDPPASVAIDISADGVFFDFLGGPIGAEDSTWQWIVSDTFAITDSCYIKVINYAERDEFALAGPFSLVKDVGVSHKGLRQPGASHRAIGNRGCAAYRCNGRRFARGSIPQNAAKGMIIVHDGVHNNYEAMKALFMNKKLYL